MKVIGVVFVVCLLGVVIFKIVGSVNDTNDAMDAAMARAGVQLPVGAR
jgi:hypothetical protein